MKHKPPRNKRGSPHSLVHPVTVELSKSDKKQMIRVAKKLGLTMGAFGRECIKASLTVLK